MKKLKIAKLKHYLPLATWKLGAVAQVAILK